MKFPPILYAYKLVFCMLVILFYFVNCVIISCKLSHSFLDSDMSFLGFQKAELGCKLAKLGCNEAGLDCHNTKVKNAKFFDARGRTELLENNNFSQTSSTRCKQCCG